MRFNVGVNNVGRHYYTRSGKFDETAHYHFEGPKVTDTHYEIPRIMDLQLDSLNSPTRITGMLTVPAAARDSSDGISSVRRSALIVDSC